MEKIEKDFCQSKIESSIDFEFYKILFDPVRSQIMVLLGSKENLSISEVSKYFPQDRTVISRHLSLMERYGIVTRVKKSRELIYHLNSDFVIEKFEKTARDLRELANC